jgi:hypothetical protein
MNQPKAKKRRCSEKLEWPRPASDKKGARPLYCSAVVLATGVAVAKVKTASPSAAHLESSSGACVRFRGYREIRWGARATGAFRWRMYVSSV